MKIHGSAPEPNVVPIVIPRPGDNNIVFTAGAIMSYKEFTRLCPNPTPPAVVKPGGKKIVKYDDPDFIKQCNAHDVTLQNWIVITSLRGTEGLEWEKVDYNNPNTWGEWEQELKDAQFAPAEIGYIRRKVFEANALDQDKLDEALKLFQQVMVETAPST